jgi:hypothetical protein
MLFVYFVCLFCLSLKSFKPRVLLVIVGKLFMSKEGYTKVVSYCLNLYGMGDTKY